MHGVRTCFLLPISAFFRADFLFFAVKNLCNIGFLCYNIFPLLQENFFRKAFGNLHGFSMLCRFMIDGGSDEPMLLSLRPSDDFEGD